MPLPPDHARLISSITAPAAAADLAVALDAAAPPARLALAAAASQAAHATGAPTALPAWRAAVRALRALAPALADSKRNGAAATASRAAVENHAALYALAAAEMAAAGSVEAADAQGVAADALRAVLVAAAAAGSFERRGRGRRGADGGAGGNDNSSEEDAGLLDRVVFPGASALGYSRLLPSASAKCAAVVVPALLARIRGADAPLRERTAAARALLVPWVKCMEAAAAATGDARAAAAYRRKGRGALLRAAEGKGHPPLDVLRARVAAARLFPGDPAEFAKTVHRAANLFLRSCGPRDYGVVAELYCDAVVTFQRCHGTDEACTREAHEAEDVSAWFDHVYVSYVKTGEERYRRKALSLAALRMDALSESTLQCAAEAQHVLVDGGLYESNIERWTKASTTLATAASCAEALLDEASAANMKRLASLRILRALEPVRSTLCSSKSFSHGDASSRLLQCYVNISKGALKSFTPDEYQDDLQVGALKERIVAMAGAALTACETLLRFYAANNDADSVSATVEDCVAIVTLVRKDFTQWSKWLAVMLNNCGIDIYNRHVKGNAVEDKRMMAQAGLLMEASAKWLAATSLPSSRIDFDDIANGAFPDAAETQVPTCSKRLAFAADSFLVAGSSFLADSLRAATLGLRCCAANNICPLPPEICLSFARSAAEAAGQDVTRLRMSLWQTAEQKCNRTAFVDAALEAAQTYRIYVQKKLLRHEIMRVDFLPREYGLYILLHDVLIEATNPGAHRADNVDLAYRKGRLDVMLGVAEGRDAVRSLCSRFYIEEPFLGHRNGNITRSRKGSRSVKQTGVQPSPGGIEESGVYMVLLKLWSAVECLQYALMDALLENLEGQVSAVFKTCEKDALSSLHSSFTLFDVLETLESFSFVLANRDVDAYAVRLQTLSRLICRELRLPHSQFDVADSYRRLGFTRQCFSVLLSDESAGSGDCIAVRCRILNDLARYTDAEAIANTVDDAPICGAGADAALYGRGDVRVAMERTRAAMKLVLRTLSSARIKESVPHASFDVLDIAGVKVVVPALQSSGMPLALVFNRSRHAQLRELVQCLARLAILFDRVDNIRDARYYADKCAELSERLTTPSFKMHCKLLSDRIPRRCCSTETPPRPTVCSRDAPRESPYENPLTTARLLVEGGCFALASTCSSASSLADDIAVALGMFDRAALCLERAEAAQDIDAEIISSVTATLLTNRGRTLLLGRSLKAASSAFELALEVSLANQDCRMEAFVGMAETQYRLGKLSDALDTLRTSKSAVADETIAAPRLIKRMCRLLAEVKLASGTFDPIISAAIADSLLEVHGASLGLRRVLCRSDSRRAMLEDDNVQAAIKTLESLTLCESATSRLNAALSSSDVLVGLTLSMNRDALILWQVTPSRQPFAMRLSIPAEGPSSYASVMQRLRKILSTMKTMTVSDGVLSTKEKKAWWTKRFALDHKLGQLMVDVEDEWLGDARIFLLPASFRGDTVFHSSAPCAAFGAAAAHFPELVSSSSIESVLDRSYPEDDNSVSAPLVESMVARAQRNTSEAAKVATSQRAKRTRQSKRTVARKGDSATLETCSGELLLAVDTELECLPWESLPVLRAAKCGVSRLPHESFLLPSSPTMDVDPSSVFYLLNPSGDLRATQETFQEVFESQYGWTGNVGVEAKKCGMDETMAKLDLSDVFVYCGHGGGEALVPPRRLATSVPRVPVSILMGCSSGRLEQFSGGAESSGTAVEYLLAGAPAVVANMWDVSDRDIDRLTGSLLTNWIGIPSVVEETRAVDEEGLSVGECSLSVALARSRDACRLPYLVGASTVLYGNGWIRCAD